MNTILILDVETTAIQPQDGHLLEVGMILFSVADRAVLGQLSFLEPVAENPVEHINKIPAALSSRVPATTFSGLKQAAIDFAQLADAYVAHNADFDRSWVGRFLPEKPWICSMVDIEWPLVEKKNPSLQALALAHGIPVWAAHRALTDCIYLAQVFERTPDLESVLLEGLQPRFVFQALVQYEQNQDARDAGFRWDKEKRAWLRRMTPAAAQKLQFPTKVYAES